MDENMVDPAVLLERPAPEDVARVARMLASTTPADGARFRGIRLAELRQRPPPAYIVDGYLQADSLAVLEGVDGTYKTFLALAWAHCVALGRHWFGRQVVQGRVLYLLGEGSRGVPRRADAWQIVNIGARQDVEDLLFVVDEMPQLWHGDASQVVSDNAGPFVLIVVDTLARSMVGGNENLQQDMGQFVAGCDQLRRAYDGACVLSLHHLNANGRSRGSTSLPGAISTKLRIDREGSSRSLTLTNSKQREDDLSPPVQLVARTVELGSLDDRGRPETSLVLDATGPGGSGPISGPLTRAEQLALTALSGPVPALYAAWRDNSGLKLSTFKDARLSLIRRGLVEHLPDGQYRLTPEGRRGPEQGRLQNSDPGIGGGPGEGQKPYKGLAPGPLGPALNGHPRADLPW